MAINEKEKKTNEDIKEKNKKKSENEKIAKDEDKSKKEQTASGNEPKPSMSDEAKQRVVGLALIGAITIGLCISGMVGTPENSIPTANAGNDVSISSQADESSSAPDTSDSSSRSSEGSSDKDENDAALSSDDMTSGSQSEAESDEDEENDTPEAEGDPTDETPISGDEEPSEQPAVTDPPAAQPEESKTTTTKTTTTTTKKPASSSGGGLSVSCNAGNSWDAADGHYTQLDIDIKNSSSSDKSGWTVKVTVPSGTTISQSWSGDYSVSGTTLTIKPVDYNTTVPANGAVNLGCIIVTSGDFTPSVTIE